LPTGSTKPKVRVSVEMVGGAEGGGGSAQAASKNASASATTHRLVIVDDITNPSKSVQRAPAPLARKRRRRDFV
jgi:hypothetical protein